MVTFQSKSLAVFIKTMEIKSPEFQKMITCYQQRSLSKSRSHLNALQPPSPFLSHCHRILLLTNISITMAARTRAKDNEARLDASRIEHDEALKLEIAIYESQECIKESIKREKAEREHKFEVQSRHLRSLFEEQEELVESERRQNLREEMQVCSPGYLLPVWSND